MILKVEQLTTREIGLGAKTMKYNFNKMREDLLDRYEAASFFGLGAASLDVSEIRHASEEELLDIARREGLSLFLYEIED